MDQTAETAGNRIVVDKIIARIKESDKSLLRFRDYMEMCLYDPDGGYYTSDKSKIGREGDFYTSSHIGSILGDVLARYIGRLASDQEGIFTVTEWGAGTGRLARQILDRIREEDPGLYARLEYRIAERSPHHRRILQEALSGHDGAICIMETVPPGNYGPGLVFSNELLDAFPVHRVRRRREVLTELHVGWDPVEGRFFEAELPCTDPAVLEYLDLGRITLRDGQTADLNLEAGRWIKEQAERLQQGTPLVTIDYGDVSEELFGSHRMAGTLMCYKAHKAYDNPYIHAGEQDITAHVDFSCCIRSGLEAGLSDWKLATQKQFLMDNGILELLQQHGGSDPFSPAAKRNRAIRQILLSDSMSELFKVLIQRK